MFVSWILDHLPWWFWFVAAGAAAVATVPVWWPIARGIWFVLPGWAKAAIIGTVVALAAYLAGRNKGLKNEQDRQRRRDAGAIKTRLGTNERVERMKPAERDKELDRWSVD